MDHCLIFGSSLHILMTQTSPCHIIRLIIILVGLLKFKIQARSIIDYIATESTTFDHTIGEGRGSLFSLFHYFHDIVPFHTTLGLRGGIG